MGEDKEDTVQTTEDKRAGVSPSKNRGGSRQGSSLEKVGSRHRASRKEDQLSMSFSPQKTLSLENERKMTKAHPSKAKKKKNS